MLPSLLPFERLPVTILVTACYLAAIISTFVIQNRLPAAPTHQRSVGLNLDEAWQDLQTIANVAHPFNSHANDRVHDYISHILRKKAINQKDFIEIDDYSPTNVTFYRDPRSVAYFESRNIVIKFEGSRYNDSAILWGAHYDSVSLAPGATDDGIGIVSLLQLSDYFASEQPERTMIILFNGGEEDGLNGAQVFLRHPWARLVGSFVNVEGAGSGGRPNLFRTSSAQITTAFKSSVHPHGSSVFSDAFQLGAIRSRTDYDVYTTVGISGADFAFYQGRQKYHTIYDSVASLGDRRPLWSMMENLHSAAKSLAYEPDGLASNTVNFIYFDLFGEDMFYLRYDLYVLLGIGLVLLGPVLVGLLGYWLYRSEKIPFGKRGWGRFPISCLVGVGLAASCVGWYTDIKPMISFRFPNLVLLSIACMVTLGIMVPLYLFDWWHPVATQRLQILIEMYGFWWLALVLNLAFTAKLGLGATYFITFFYLASLTALLVDLIDLHRLHHVPILVASPTRIDGRGVSHERHHEDGHRNHSNERLDTEGPTERSPLVPREEHVLALSIGREGEGQLGWIWALEFLLLVVFPVILMLQILFAMSDGLSPTVVDGSSPAFVYAVASGIIFLIAFPVAPFAHKVSPYFFGVLLFIGLSTFAFNTLLYPFSPNAAFKAYYRQTVDLDTGNSNVTLIGLENYLRKIIEEVPSIDFNSIKWAETSSDPMVPTVGGLIQATYDALPPRSNPGVRMEDWINATFEKRGSTSIRARISGKDTRTCRLYFEGGYNVSQAVIRGADQTRYETPASEPLKVVELWSRSWNSTWEVDLELVGPSGSSSSSPSFFSSSSSSSSAFASHPDVAVADVLRGRVSCVWSEREEGKIPALDDLFVFFPTWATLTTLRGGFVEGWKYFSV